MSASPPPQTSTGGTTASPEQGPVLDLSHRRVLIIIGALMLGIFLAALDQTIVSTALPTIVADLHGASHLAWIVVAYLLAVTVSTPLSGKLGDQYGREVFFQAAIVIVLCGSALSGLSRTMTESLFARGPARTWRRWARKQAGQPPPALTGSSVQRRSARCLCGRTSSRCSR